jgi:hypothetical protein
MANPLQSLIPKDNQGPGMGKELGEKLKMQSDVEKSLHPTGAPAKPEPVGGAPASWEHVNQPKYGAGPGEKRIDTSTMTKPLGQMHKGGTVPKTGPYIMKAGEKVLTPEQHGHITSALSLAQSALSHEPEKQPEVPKDIHEMHVRKADNGGFVVKHIHKHFEHPPEEHVHANMDSLHDHLEQHWGEPNDGENASETEQDKSPGVVALQKTVGLEK